jgi:uncharacterized protein (TIGR02145 family)
MCKNLGATKEIRSVADIGKINAINGDPDNFREYHGSWYRFGVHTASLVNDGQYDGGTSVSVPNWSTSNTAYFPVDLNASNWRGTTNGNFGNPCPDGWRLPTRVEWEAVINQANNTITPYKGTEKSSLWSADNSATPSGNYNNIMQIGDYLFLPAAGIRYSTNGSLTGRGQSGDYWSIKSGSHMYFYGNSTSVYVTGNSIATDLANGYSVRCIEAD